MKQKKPRAGGATRVVVIGGGLMGTASALLLREQGADVTVLEKAVPGAEASTIAAGILGAEVENELPGPMTELCRKSRALYPAWITRLRKTTSIDPEFLEGGTLLLPRDASEAKRQKKAHSFQIEEGRARILSGPELTRLEPQLAAIKSGLYFPGDARITPKLLFKAVHLAAQKAGVVFRSGAIVKRIATKDGGVRPIATGVALDDGTTIEADRVVLAAGSWTSLVAGVPGEIKKVVPARGQLLELTGERILLERLVFGEGVYLIPRNDGRILVGSTLEFVGYKKGVTAKGVSDLLRGAIALVPALADAELTATWSNFRPYTGDHLPLLGNAGIENLVIASGHYRNGILLAPITAEIVTSLCLGKKPPLDLAAFSPLRA